MFTSKTLSQDQQAIRCFCLAALDILYVDLDYAQNIQVIEEEGELPKLNERPQSELLCPDGVRSAAGFLGNLEPIDGETPFELEGQTQNNLTPWCSLKEYLTRNSEDLQTIVGCLDHFSYTKKLSKAMSKVSRQSEDNMCFRQHSKWFIFPQGGKHMFGKFKHEDYYKLWLSTLEPEKSPDSEIISDTQDPEMPKSVVQRENSREFKFLAFGKPGVGKSSLLNHFFDKRSPFESSSSKEGVTKRIQSERGEFHGYPFKVFDTPGIGDLSVNLSKWILQFYQNQLFCEKFDKLFFVMRADYPIDQYEILTLRLITEFVHSSNKDPSKNIVIIFTHYDKLDEDQNLDFKKKANEKLDKINRHLNKAWGIRTYYCSTKGDQTTIEKILSDSSVLTKNERLALKTPTLSAIKGIAKDLLGVELDIKLQQPENKKCHCYL